MRLVKHNLTGDTFDLDNTEHVARCRATGVVFDPDDTTPMEPGDVVGCGKREHDLILCTDCAIEYGTTECAEWREKKNLTLTTLAAAGMMENL